MLELEPESITVTTELEGSPERPSTVYLISYPGGQRRILLSEVLEYVERHLKGDPLAERLPRR